MHWTSTSSPPGTAYLAQSRKYCYRIYLVRTTRWWAIDVLWRNPGEDGERQVVFAEGLGWSNLRDAKLWSAAYDRSKRTRPSDRAREADAAVLNAGA